MNASSQSITNGLEHVGSLSSSLINGPESLVIENGTVARLPASPTLNRKSDGRHYASAKGRSINGNVMLKQALSSNILTSLRASLASVCLRSTTSNHFNVEIIYTQNFSTNWLIYSFTYKISLCGRSISTFRKLFTLTGFGSCINGSNWNIYFKLSAAIFYGTKLARCFDKEKHRNATK